MTSDRTNPLWSGCKILSLFQHHKSSMSKSPFTPHTLFACIHFIGCNESSCVSVGNLFSTHAHAKHTHAHVRACTHTHTHTLLWISEWVQAIMEQGVEQCTVYISMIKVSLTFTKSFEDIDTMSYLLISCQTDMFLL